MQYLWYTEYALVVICLVLFAGWMLWLLRSRHEWSSGLAIKFVGTIVLVALFGFPYNILCNPQIWKELFSGDFTSPHILIFLLAWIWIPFLWMFWESALIYFIARRAEQSGQPQGLLKAIILISPSPVLGWLTATPQLAYLGHWTLFECAILILGGVVLSSMFPLITYLMLEPVVNRRFGRSAEFEGLGRRLSVATWILFVNVVICSIGVLLGNVYTESPGVVVSKVIGTLLLFGLPYVYFVWTFTRSIAKPVEELQESENKYRTLLENLPQKIFQKDTDLVYVSCNENFAQDLKIRPEEFKGKTDYEFFPEELAEKYRADDRRIITSGKTEDIEEKYLRDGQEIWVQTLKTPIKDKKGTITGLLGIFWEITERKRMEEALLKARDELEERVEERTTELSKANTLLKKEIAERKQAEEKLKRYASELERSNQELQQFAYVASHDLQEPLRMVASYTQLLAKRYKGKLDSDADEFIAYAVDGATRMQALINDLLTYSRVGTKGKDFKPIDCKTVLERTLDNLKKAVEESRAELTYEPLPTVMADDVQLGQLFQNLIGNAIKFRSEESPHIHISAERNEDKWIFSVGDNGIGIDPEFTERIFIIFQRLHKRRDYPGTGIGLAVCKKIVERHGGRIWVESKPEKGSTFYFTIPLRGGISHE